MGIYINPRYMSKEEWLAANGEDIMGEPSFHRLGDQVIVCLVDNGGFTAAGVAFCQSERDAFAYPDGRSKRWFLVPITALVEVDAIASPNDIDPEF